MAIVDYKTGIAAAKRRATELPLAVLRATLQEAGNRIIDRSPVLSGNLVNNYALTRNAPNLVEEAFVSPVRDGAKQRLIAALAGIKLGDVVFFSNSTSYGVHVEYGTHKQDARQMVGITVAELPSIARDAAAALQNG